MAGGTAATAATPAPRPPGAGGGGPSPKTGNGGAGARGGRRYRDTAAQVRGRVALVSKNVNERVGDAKKTLMGRYSRAKKKVSRLQRDSSRYVRDNPGKVLLSIAGVGLLVGLVVSPRRRLARA